VVWDAAEAAFTYFHDIVQGLAHLAEVAEQAAVSALTAVGAALEAALQALLAFVEREVTAFIQKVLGWITEKLAQVSSLYFTPLANAFCSCSGTSPTIVVPPTNRFGQASWGSSIQGIITATAAIVSVVLIVLTIIQVLSFGTSDLVTLVIGTIATMILMGFSQGGSTPRTSLAFTASTLFSVAMDTTVNFINSIDPSSNLQQAENTLDQAAFTAAAALTSPLIAVIAAILSPSDAGIGYIILGIVVQAAIALAGIFILANILAAPAGSPWTIGGYIGDGLALYGAAAATLGLYILEVNIVKALELRSEPGGEEIDNNLFLAMGIVGALNGIVLVSSVDTLINHG
jgi:hypothetical protein